MAYQAIYRKWRPAVFEDIVGQNHITQTLRNQIMSGHISHAYLFCGTRGTGKTTALTAGTKARRVQLTLDIPEGEGRLVAEYFMISSFDTRRPYSKVIAK